MIIDGYMRRRVLRLQRNNPELWNFFEGVEAYKNDSREDLNCRRWEDTLSVAYFISTGDPIPIKCVPGEMTLCASNEYRDHHSDEGVDLTFHRARLISEDRYQALQKAYDELDENYKDSLRFDFTNVLYRGGYAEVLEDGFLILPPQEYQCYRHKVAVAGRVKGVEGFYLFEFFEG